MANTPEIITLSGKTPAASYLVAVPTNAKEIFADEGVVALGAFIGMVCCGVAFAFNGEVDNGVNMVTAIMSGMLGMAVGGLLFGIPTFLFSITNELRNEIEKLNSMQKKISMLDACKAIFSFRSKKTIISLGTDRLGNQVQAYVKSGLTGTTLAQVIAPKVIDTWDESAATVANLYGISKQA